MSIIPLKVHFSLFGRPMVTDHRKWMLRHTITSFFDNPRKNQTSFSMVNHKNINVSLLVTSCISKTIKSNVGSDTKTVVTTLEFEKKHEKAFWFRKWDLMDLTNLFWFGSMHVLGACAPFVFNWGAFWVAIVLAYITGIGVTLGYHRLLSHRSFKVPKWIEYFFVYCGAHALQREPIFWVSMHKYHHQHVDTERDPHTPNQGFWFSHMGWFFYNDYLATKFGESKSGEYSNVDELKKQPFYRFLQDTYFCHPLALAIILYLFGGFPYLAWGMGMRTVVVYHITFLATSVSHLWGERSWNTPDTSTNNWWVAMLTMGEGWHNNHHAFPKSARHGLEWWQFDMTWQVINFLRLVGLATQVKLPTEAERKKMALSSS